MTKGQIRDLVVARTKSRCEYCFSPLDFSSDDFAVEHIVPKSLLGSDDLDNLALSCQGCNKSCQGCNNRKFVALSAIDPVTGVETRLFHPRLDVWLEHFL
jgi:HNH endonuclease